MRDVKIKTVYGKNSARVTLAHPQAALGSIGSVQIQQVNNIPGGISNADIVRLFSQTADVSYLYGEPRTEFDFEELGVGKILR